MSNTISNRPYLDHPQRTQLLLSYHGRAVALVAKLLQAGVEPAKVYPYNLPRLTVQVAERRNSTDLVFHSEGEPVTVRGTLKAVSMHRTGSTCGSPAVWDLLTAEQFVADDAPSHDDRVADSLRALETAHAMLAEIGSLVVYPQACALQHTDNRFPSPDELMVPGDWIVITPELRAVLDAYFMHVARTGYCGISRMNFQHPIEPDDEVIYIGRNSVPVGRRWLSRLDAPTRKRFMKVNCGCTSADVDAFEASLQLAAPEAG